MLIRQFFFCKSVIYQIDSSGNLFNKIGSCSYLSFLTILLFVNPSSPQTSFLGFPIIAAVLREVWFLRSICAYVLIQSHITQPVVWGGRQEGYWCMESCELDISNKVVQEKMFISSASLWLMISMPFQWEFNSKIVTIFKNCKIVYSCKNNYNPAKKCPSLFILLLYIRKARNQ